jgi:hypothetical protein
MTPGDDANSTTSVRTVVVVLAEKFATDLVDLARTNHVWALRTPALEEAAKEIWDMRQQLPGDQLSGGDVTLFNDTGDTESDLLYTLEQVELHHGLPSGRTSAVQTITVLGSEPTVTIREVLDSLGFTRVELIADGFVAHWHVVGE